MFDDPKDWDELSSAEQAAFAALPREIAPRPALEERTVAALMARGALPTPIAAAPSHRTMSVRRFWIPVAAAASLAIFASGLAVGQFLGSRSAFTAIRYGASASEAAERFERVGNRYVEALTALSSADSVNPAVRDSVRAVALKVLGDAAQEMALLAPDDPLAAAVLRGLQQRNRQQHPDAPTRSVVWY
jgi:hypothetical protein